jgi:Protein of unknown function (DUF2516)
VLLALPISVDGWIMFLISWAGVVTGVFAFGHALTQRADAYTATEKLSKPAWLGITAGGTAGCALFPFGTSLFILWIAGLVAVLVYLVDVRPRLIDVQRGSKS